MQLSIHYYIILLSDRTSRLYEGFREQLIDIQNTKFPLEFSIESGSFVAPAAKETRLREFYDLTDQNFAHYFAQDPLRLIVAGEKGNLAIFDSLTIHRDIIIGTVEGDYTATSPTDLGKIVWPVVKDAIAGAHEHAMFDLAAAVKTNKVVSGLDAVGQSAEKNAGATLYVEDDYHVKGCISIAGNSLTFSRYVNLMQAFDDIVDIIIENVLRMGGSVIFMRSGSLVKLDRIALLLSG